MIWRGKTHIHTHTRAHASTQILSIFPSIVEKLGVRLEFVQLPRDCRPKEIGRSKNCFWKIHFPLWKMKWSTPFPVSCCRCRFGLNMQPTVPSVFSLSHSISELVDALTLASWDYRKMKEMKGQRNTYVFVSFFFFSIPPSFISLRMAIFRKHEGQGWWKK